MDQPVRERTPTLAALGRVSIFNGLEPAAMELLADLVVAESAPAGTVVIHQGDFGDRLYLVSEGEVEVVVRNQEGAESVMSTLRAGDFFGEMALLTGAPRSASVRTTTPSTLLYLRKADFDAFLAGHPSLALVFTRILAERVSDVNRRLLRQVGREEELRRILTSEQDLHATRLVGSATRVQAVARAVSEAAAGRDPVLIAGPPGAAVDDVAHQLHAESPRREKPFLVADLSGGEEWRTWSARAREAGGADVAEEHLFEEYQLSTLFGHEAGSLPGASASRLGYLELADGGTLVLKGVEMMAPGVRERLTYYLREGRFYRLGIGEPFSADARLVGTTESAAEGEDLRRSLRGRIPSDFLGRIIELPTLASRRRDIPAIAQSFLERHAALHAKRIAGFSQEAMNTLVRYSWPGNDRELDSVVERGVLVAEEAVLQPEHIFLGIRPYQKKGRLNLLKFPLLRAAFAAQGWRRGMQWATVAAVGGMAALGLAGPALPGHRLGPILFWHVMLPSLFTLFFLLGRIYCSICPFWKITDLTRRLGSRNAPPPRRLARSGTTVAMAGMFLFFLGEEVLDLRHSPAGTALFLLALAGAAVLANALFTRETWCRQLCPMSFLAGLFSGVAVTEVRANASVCSSQCKSTPCFRGTEERSGCPQGLLPVTLTANQPCKFCGTCVATCPNRSIHLDLRLPGAELYENAEPDLAAALASPAMGGILVPMMLVQAGLLGAAPASYGAAYLGAGLLAVGLVALAALPGGREEYPGRLARLSLGTLPLVFAGHLSFQAAQVMAGLKALVPGFPSGGHLDWFVQGSRIALVLVGTVWSLAVLQAQGHRGHPTHRGAARLVVAVAGIALALLVATLPRPF